MCPHIGRWSRIRRSPRRRIRLAAAVAEAAPVEETVVMVAMVALVAEPVEATAATAALTAVAEEMVAKAAVEMVVLREAEMAAVEMAVAMEEEMAAVVRVAAVQLAVSVVQLAVAAQALVQRSNGHLHTQESRNHTATLLGHASPSIRTGSMRRGCHRMRTVRRSLRTGPNILCLCW